MPLVDSLDRASGHKDTTDVHSTDGPNIEHAVSPALWRLREIPDELRGLSKLWDGQGQRSEGHRLVNARIRLPGGEELQAPITRGSQGQPAVMLRDGPWGLRLVHQRSDAPVYELSAFSFAGHGLKGSAPQQGEQASPSQRQAKRLRLDEPGGTTGEPTRAPTIDSSSLARLVVSATFPLRLENQRESTRLAGTGTNGAHALNQAFQAAVASAASLQGGGLKRLKTEMRDLANSPVHHHELHEGMGEPGDYEAQRKQLCREFDHSCVGVAEIGKFQAEDKGVGNHMVTLVRVAEQPEMDAGVWLLDSVMKAPIWFADIDAAFHAIEQVNEHGRNEGRRFLSVLVPKEPLPPVLGAQSALVQDRGLVLSHHLRPMSLMGEAAAAWNLDIKDLPSTAGHSPLSGKLDHGDPDVWIAQLTVCKEEPQTPPEDGTSIDSDLADLSIEPSRRPGAQTPEARWLGAFLDMPLQPTSAAIEALLQPPPHGPLVDHYAHVLREHYGPIATTQHLPTKNDVDRFADRFELREHRLLVTLRLGDDGEGASRTYVLRRGHGNLWSAHSEDGMPSGQPPAKLAELLNHALESADAGGLRVLRMAPADEELVNWAVDKTDPERISDRDQIGAIRRLVRHLEGNGVPVSALALGRPWPLGPTDRDVERALLSLVARGAVRKQEHVQAIVTHLGDADARRAAVMARYDKEIAQWHEAWKAFDTAAPDERDEAEDKPDVIEKKVLATREEIDHGGRDALAKLVNRVAQGGGLPFNLHELALLLPHSVPAVQAATALPRTESQTSGSRRASRGGSQTPRRRQEDPVILQARRTRPIFTAVLRRCPPPPDSTWDIAKFTLGSRREDAYEPRYRLNRQLRARYEHFLQELKDNKKITGDTQVSLRGSMLRLLRLIEEGTAPLASNPLDADDALPRVHALVDSDSHAGGPNGKDAQVLTWPNGFVTWLDGNLTDERRVPAHEQGEAVRPRPPVARGYSAAELASLQGEYREAALRAQEILLRGDLEESAVSHQRRDYKFFLEHLQAGKVRLTTELVNLVPVGELAQALRAFGETPTFDANADRAALLHIAASTSDPAAALIGIDRFPLLPDSLGSAIVLHASHKRSALRTAVNRVHGLHLMGDKVNINHPPRLAVHAELMRRMYVRDDADGRRMLLNWIVRLEERWTQAHRMSLGSGASHDSLLPDDIRGLLSLDNYAGITNMKRVQQWLDEQELPDMPLQACNAERLDRYLATLADGTDRDDARRLILPWIKAEEAPLTDLYADPVLEAVASNDLAAFQARVASKLGQAQLSQEQQRVFAGLHASGLLTSPQ